MSFLPIAKAIVLGAYELAHEIWHEWRRAVRRQKGIESRSSAAGAGASSGSLP